MYPVCKHLECVCVCVRERSLCADLVANCLNKAFLLYKNLRINIAKVFGIVALGAEVKFSSCLLVCEGKTICGCMSNMDVGVLQHVLSVYSLACLYYRCAILWAWANILISWHPQGQDLCGIWSIISNLFRFFLPISPSPQAWPKLHSAWHPGMLLRRWWPLLLRHLFFFRKSQDHLWTWFDQFNYRSQTLEDSHLPCKWLWRRR